MVPGNGSKFDSDLCYPNAVNAAFTKLDQSLSEFLFNYLAREIIAMSFDAVPVTGPVEELLLRSGQFLIRVSNSDQPGIDTIKFGTVRTGKFVFPNNVGSLSSDTAGVLFERTAKKLLKDDGVDTVIELQDTLGFPPTTVYIRIVYSKTTGFVVASVGSTCELSTPRTYVFRYEVDNDNGQPFPIDQFSACEERVGGCR
jgi:hypothetical protein